MIVKDAYVPQTEEEQWSYIEDAQVRLLFEGLNVIVDKKEEGYVMTIDDGVYQVVRKVHDLFCVVESLCGFMAGIAYRDGEIIRSTEGYKEAMRN